MSLARRVTVYLALAVVLVALGWWGYYRAAYHTFAFWQAPPELSYCGYDYERLPGPAATRLPPGTSSTPVDSVEPEGWKLYATDPTDPGDRQPGDSCTSELFLGTGAHTYLPYNLLGGP